MTDTDETLKPASPGAPDRPAPAFLSSSTPEQAPGRIEGGYEAVVVGANVDGLVAAAYLGKAGLKTVLLEAGVAPPQKREFAPGYFADDGDFLVRDLDPEVISALDLYRHGLCFVQRRFDSMYYFADKSALFVNGDLYSSYESIAEMHEEDADGFQRFVQEILEAASELRPFFAGEAPNKLSKRTERLLDDFAGASVEQMLDRHFDNARLKDLLAAEASLNSGLRPTDPHSFFSLIRRWSGEAAGLQGACAFASGGYVGLHAALRRAVQNIGVEIRRGGDIKSMLVEWDGVAGVAMEDGGQIRAPVVVNALNGTAAFIDQIGPELIDIEFQKAVTTLRPKYAAAKVHFALTGAPRDAATRKNLSRRLVYTPDVKQLRCAYRMARDGEAAPALLTEMIFPSVFESGWAPEGGILAAAWMHPVPYTEDPSDELRETIRKSALSTLEKIAPGASERLEAVDVALVSDRADRLGVSPDGIAGVNAILAEAQRARAARSASGVKGVFFCGREAQIGHGANGAAGRSAGKAAARYGRRQGARI